jgi:hypothetical protein
MAIMVRSENDLPTLRVLLDRRARSRSEVVFQTVRGRGTATEVARCSTSELGLPERITAYSMPPDEAFQVPSHVLARVQGAVSGLGIDHGPELKALWLELPSPRGYLYLAPWERMLDQLDYPVLRLPYHTVRPKASSRKLEIAICAGEPEREPPGHAKVLEQLAGRWQREAGHQTTVHVFTDSESFQALATVPANLGTSVVLHDPAQARSFTERERPSRAAAPHAVGNPWLLWIRDALQGRALDVLHFVNRGFLSGDRGAIALAGTPMRSEHDTPSRFLGAAEVCSFMSQVGAWTLMLTGPPANRSGAGLRELADAVAQTHPGVTLVHELSVDPAANQFGEMVSMVFAGGPPVAHPLNGTSTWVHPRFVEYPGETADAFAATDRASLIKDATTYAIDEAQTPAWVAAGARYLEAQQADWLPSDPDEAADPDAIAALESVSELLDQHVAKHLRSREGGGS